MGDMALGYGSEFHLLRWLGRHRRLFTEKVCEAAHKGWKHIDWLDFGFADGRLVPDSELCGIDFLQAGSEERKNVEREIKVGEYRWTNVPSERMMNWDAVGIADDGTYILAEAKAHTEEIGGKCKAKSKKSQDQIEHALSLPMSCFGVKSDVNWIESDYYQLANRLYMVSLLERCGLKAVFLYILFTGDKFPGSAKEKCPQKMEGKGGWREALKKEYDALGLDEESPYFQEHVIVLGLPVVDSQSGSGVWKRGAAVVPPQR
ncbi:MAG: hypothetical protein IJQ73_01805 [Kiritimatiellae bacterium]|nr:hypothetical protein [Kiritimatiellia bacterium]